MSANSMNLTLKERQLMQQASLKVHVHFKPDWRVHLGIKVIEIGAWLAGIGRTKIVQEDLTNDRSSRSGHQ
jgi:hypothetical protein